MFLVYCDETGDPGAATGTTPYFVVTALIIHESKWESMFSEIKKFRKLLRDNHDIPLGIELKGHSIINGRPTFHRLKSSSKGFFRKRERLQIMKKTIDFLATLHQICEVQNVCFRKTKTPNSVKEAKELARIRFMRSWEYTLQRLEAHVFHNESNDREAYSTFYSSTIEAELLEFAPDLKNQRAAVISDHTQNDLLRKLSRRMHAFNYVPYRSAPGEEKKSRSVPIKHILGDPLFVESHHTYFIQAADLIGYCLAKHYFPASLPSKYKAINLSKLSPRLEDLFPRLEPILCKKAAAEEPFGVKFIEDQ